MKLRLLILLFISSMAYGQNFYAFNPQPDSFPIVRANFFAYDKNSDQYVDLSKQDFEVKENGEIRQVVRITCPPYSPPLEVSCVLLIDISGSMAGSHLSWAQMGANAWINMMNKSRNETAITSFSDLSYINRDFTDNKESLSKAVKLLYTMNHTNYDEALINEYSGAISVASKGKYAKKIIIFLSDGAPTNTPQNEKIIQKANEFGITIYSISIGGDRAIMRMYAERTGGKFFEGFRTVEDFENCYRYIMILAQGGGPCEIDWLSKQVCSPVTTEAQITLLPLGLTSKVSYKVPDSLVSKVNFNPSYVYFRNIPPGKSVDTVIKFTAINSDISVVNVTSSNPYFSVDKTKFTVLKNQSIDLTVSYVPIDSSYAFTKFLFETETCKYNLSISAGFPGVKPKNKSLRLIKPNGGETFVIGADTLIQWTGVADSDYVALEYTYDAGLTWQTITGRTNSLEYIWKNIPKPESRKCKVKVKQLFEPELRGKSIFEAFTFPFHEASVQEVAYNPDETKIASISSDGVVYVWEAFTGMLLGKIQNSSYAKNSLKWSDDGTTLLSAGSGNSLRLFNTNNYSNIKTYYGNDAKINSAVIHPLGDRVFSCSDNGRIIGWDVQSGLQSYNNLEQYKTKILSLVRSGNGNYMLSCGTDNNAMLRNGKTGLMIITYTGHSKQVNQANFNFNNSRIVTASSDKTAKIWETNTGKQLFTLAGHNSEVLQAEFSPDGSKVLTVGTDSSVVLWNANTGDKLLTYKGNKATITKAKWRPDGKFLASGDVLGNIKIWEAITGNTVQELYGHKNRVNELCWNKLGFKLISTSSDKTAKVWDINTESAVLQYDESDSFFSIVAPHPEARDIDMGLCLVNSSKDSTIVEMVLNYGVYPFNVDSIYFTGADAEYFRLVTEIPKFNLLPGGYKSADIAFNPKRVGLHTAQVVIRTQSDTLIKNIIGVGVQPELVILNNTIDFGKVFVGYPKDTLKAVTVQNAGNRDLYISKTAHKGPNTQDFTTLAGGGSFTLKPGEIKTMDLRFKPEETGRTSGVVEFDYTGLGSPASVSLFGEGLDVLPQIASKFSRLPNVLCQNSSESELTIYNNGSKTLNVKSIKCVGANSSEFSIDVQAPFDVAPAGEKRLPVKFIPKSLGDKFADLEIYSNSQNDSVIHISLSARKDTLDLKTNVTTIDLGVLCPNETKDTIFTITNKGTVFTTGFNNYSANLESAVKSFALNTEETVALPISFMGSPKESSFSETVTITDSICGYVKTITVKGKVIAPKFDADNATFTAITGTTKSGKIQVVNNFSGPITIQNLQDLATPFSCEVVFPMTIPAGAIVDIPIKYYCDDMLPDTNYVTVNAEPCGINKSIRLVGLPTTAQALIKIYDYSAYSQETINVALILANSKSLEISGSKSLAAELSFNSSLLFPIDYPKIKVDDKTSKIEITGLPIDKKSGDTLALIKFKVGLGDAESCDLALTNTRGIDGYADISAISGTFKLLGICRDGGTRLINPNSQAQILSVRPNPATNAINIEYQLTEKGGAEFLLINDLGETVKQISYAEISDYAQRLETIKLDDLANGRYTLILKTPTISERRSVLIIR